LRRARRLMVLGTPSHVGKTWLGAGLCHAFAKRGLRVAPFKAQNTAPNVYVMPDGREIARSVPLQAVAAGIEPEVEMNPNLLKPAGDRREEVLLGQAIGAWDARAYRAELFARAWRAAREAYDRLAARYDLIVLEGAGSLVEANLRDRHLASLGVALGRCPRPAGGRYRPERGLRRPGRHPGPATPSQRRRVTGFNIKTFAATRRCSGN